MEIGQFDLTNLTIGADLPNLQKICRIRQIRRIFAGFVISASETRVSVAKSCSSGETLLADFATIASVTGSKTRVLIGAKKTDDASL